MKKQIATLMFLILAFCAVGQVIDRIEYMPERRLDERSSSSFHHFKSGANVIWSEDFSAGIPSGWQTADSGGVAHWEYRGALTEPNFYVGGQGGCEPLTGSDPIDSPTWNNGFVIFDSNYWDSGALPCSPDNFGKGQAPAPHLAYLMTDKIDLSLHAQVGLMFNHYQRNYTATIAVEVSTDGLVWQDAGLIATPDYIRTPRNAVERIDLSTLVGGQSEVWLRFVFAGNYYFWMIDDIQLLELVDNDMVMLSSSYGDFDYLERPDFNYQTYTIYPEALAPYFKHKAEVSNYGSATQTGVELKVSINKKGDSTKLYEAQTSLNEDLKTFEIKSLVMPDYQYFQGNIGQYELQHEIVQDQAEELPENNSQVHAFEISKYTYAKDHRAMESVLNPGAIVANQPMEIGNHYHINVANQKAHSVSVALSEECAPGISLYAVIYDFDLDSTQTRMIAKTSAVKIDSDYLNGLGEEKLMHLYFDAPVSLDKDAAYMVMVGSDSPEKDFKVGLSGKAEFFGSIVQFYNSSTQKWVYYSTLSTPMVRLNLGYVSNGIDDILNPQAAVLEVFPNPATDVLQWKHYAKNHTVNWQVFDMAGLCVDQGTWQTAKHQLSAGEIPIDNYAAGMYVITLMDGNDLYRGRFVKNE